MTSFEGRVDTGTIDVESSNITVNNENSYNISS
ncbi:hypothetical protein GGR10_000915 [Bartonella chomelii]|uniref:Uncharacterized protein n=1 Tax=Bartonella chomelii TaxID=236402 RepID=A0ABR6E3D9_9HYPH|nr:hypothetical protein [Bartonella chomelii]